MLIPESNQALTRKRYDWLELASEANLGAPTAMTNVVANVRTSSILAHVQKGPCAKPNPEDTLLFVGNAALVDDRGGKKTSILSNAGIQTADYLRRRHEFESYTYRRGYDALRGRIADRCRRREHQKRGFTHDHYNEFSEKCGLPVQHWILKRRVLQTRGRLHLWAGCLTSARRRPGLCNF